jgi:hypothetical protein
VSLTTRQREEKRKFNEREGGDNGNKDGDKEQQ